jgi:hypothetical protein
MQAKNQNFLAFIYTMPFFVPGAFSYTLERYMDKNAAPGCIRFEINTLIRLSTALYCLFFKWIL